MSSIGSVGSTAAMMQSMSAMRRPSAADMANKLFSALDTQGQGYLEKSDLASALSQIGSTGESELDEVFAQLDADSDGKLTQTELTDSLQRLSDQLDQQFDSLRMQGAMGGMGGMPPPPPPAQDSGFTEDELNAQLAEIGDTDDVRADLLETVLNNFSAADTDGDGKVSFTEAMAAKQAADGSAAATGTGTSTAAASGASSDDGLKVMMQIMRLMQAYGDSEQGTRPAAAISVNA
ncbi:EF-hand domain-containing protein [Parazoarcus communis]|uniref:EF-hand domain-containing protein n=1 Tax=Parazoarcus communis SWub3 = DSM 12120 TaxID=1121029 RepID=A0A323VC21_9RHOO|nr:EF-hand domain-containing protein [Parazoarcus communis]NMG68642.1 EF-hand domain-containing protein [Parazoarcus communis SWub3 = DSM 12120]PZA17778.1 EF-hand domain-containing protein [Azoarcus communis] [Parazoarcus communis SWub3 = DSM 12120]